MPTDKQIDPSRTQFRGRWYWTDSYEYRMALQDEVVRLIQENKELFRRERPFAKQDISLQVDGIDSFTEQLNLGAGIFSQAQVGHLYGMLGRAIMLLGGLQQQPDPCEPFSKDDQVERVNAEFEVNQIAKQIYLALTGQRIKDVT